MGFLLLVIPIIALLLLFILKPKRLQHLVNVSSAVLLLIIAAILTHRVIRYGAIAYSSLGGFFISML